jgi:peptide/nickel transport system substrate-binding protein
MVNPMRSLRTTLIALVAILTTALALAQPLPGEGGTLRAAMQTNPPTLDVMTNTANATKQAAIYVFESLVAFDANDEVRPVLAEGWTVSEDELVYTFPLRQGITFHNGQPMRAEDVKASLERFLAVSPRRTSLAAISEIEVVDDHTIRLHLSEPLPTLLANLASYQTFPAVMPADIIAGKGVGELETSDFIGTGPYVLVEWQPDQHIYLRRFEDYQVDTRFPRSGLTGEKIAYFDEVYLVPVPESGARVAGLLAGEFDFAEALPITQYQQIAGDPGVEAVIRQNEWWIVLDFNHHETSWGGNVHFRRAIQAALDMEEIMLAVTSGQRDFFELQPGPFFTGQPWWSDVGEATYDQRDLDAARAHLDAAGYDGEEIVILTNRDYDWMYRAVLAAADQLENRLGMNVSVQVLDWPGQRALEQSETGWAIAPNGHDYRQDPTGFESSWTCPAQRKFLCNEDLDQGFLDGSATSDFDERYAAYERMQEVLHRDVVTLGLGSYHGFQAARANLAGFEAWNFPLFWGTYRE